MSWPLHRWALAVPCLLVGIAPARAATPSSDASAIHRALSDAAGPDAAGADVAEPDEARSHDAGAVAAAPDDAGLDGAGLDGAGLEGAEVEEGRGGALRTVVRARAPQAASSRVISGSQLSLTARRSADELLELVPGLWTSRHGAEGKGPQLFLRGFDAAHGADLEVRLGGFVLNEMSNVHGQGYLDLGLIIPEAVQAIEVDKGALDVAQGPFATAGSVRFVLGVPEAERGARISYELGSTTRHRGLVRWAPRGAPTGTFVAAEAMHDRGYGENRESRRVVVLGQMRVPTPSWLGELTLLVGAQALGFGAPGVVPLADVQEERLGFYDTWTPDTSGRSERVLAGLTLVRGVGSGGVLTARASAQARHLALDENFTGRLLYPEQGDRRLQAQGLVGGGAELGLEHPLGARSTLRTGASWSLEGLSQRESQLSDAGAPWLTHRHHAVRQSALSLHAALAVRPLSVLRIDGGLRVDAFQLEVRDLLLPDRDGSALLTALSPRLRARLRLAPGWSLHAGAGRGLRPPEARTVLASAAPPASAGTGNARGAPLEVATADGAELGLAWNPSPAAQVSLSTFGTHVAHEVTFDHVSGTNLESGPSRRLGAELGARFSPLSWLELKGELALTDARFVVSGEAVPNAPRLLGSLWAGANHPSGLHGGVQVLALGPRPLANRAQAGALATVELMAGWRTGPWELRLQVDNLLDSRVRAGEYHFASHFDPEAAASPLPTLHFAAGPPRMFRGSVALTF